MERGASEEICAFAKKSEIARKSCGESAQRFTFLMKFRFKSLFSLWQWYFQWWWWQIIIITVAGHRHIIVDSACNALYVFPDKTLRAQSENQSPRWCYQTKEKRDFLDRKSEGKKVWAENISSRLIFYWEEKYVDSWIILIKVINATIHQLTIQRWLGYDRVAGVVSLSATAKMSSKKFCQECICLFATKHCFCAYCQITSKYSTAMC